MNEIAVTALAATIRELKAKGRTVVIITHRMTTVAVADKLLVMHEGTPKLYGPRDQVIAALKQPQMPVRPNLPVETPGTAVAIPGAA